MGRSPCCEGSGLKRGPWTAEEDQKLLDHIQNNGLGNWKVLPKLAGLNRCGKSCRLRWANYLRPDIKRGSFSAEEEKTIFDLHSVLGNKWSAIAAHLPGRTDNEIKNFWNTHMRRKLVRLGLDPTTHRPRPVTPAAIDAVLASLLFAPSSDILNQPRDVDNQAAVLQAAAAETLVLTRLGQLLQHLFLPPVADDLNALRAHCTSEAGASPVPSFQLHQFPISPQPGMNAEGYGHLLANQMTSCPLTTSSSSSFSTSSSSAADGACPLLQPLVDEAPLFQLEQVADAASSVTGGNHGGWEEEPTFVQFSHDILLDEFVAQFR